MTAANHRLRQHGLSSFVFFTLAFHASISVVTADDPASIEAKKKINGLPLLISVDFETGKATGWEPTDASAWTITHDGENHVYALTKKRSNYKPPVRSPYNRSLLKKLVVSDFVYEVSMLSTHPDYNHRDLCLFFGFQDDSHFYYVHLGKKTDDHANQIFIVNGKPRTKISTKTTAGTNWDDKWHRVRIERDTSSGRIAVYFDDMKTPVMEATDKSFTHGRVGVGSFDDTGNFDAIHLYGKLAKKPTRPKP